VSPKDYISVPDLQSKARQMEKEIVSLSVKICVEKCIFSVIATSYATPVVSPSSALYTMTIKRKKEMYECLFTYFIVYSGIEINMS